MSKKFLFMLLFVMLNLVALCSPNKKEKGEKMNVLKTIDLPEPRYDSKVSVESAIKNRRSIRSYRDQALELDHVSQILWAAYGITKPMKTGPGYLRGGLRAAPSAGARYPLEIYLVCGNVEQLEAGIYKYDSRNHKLELLSSGDKMQDLAKAAYGQSHVKNAAANIFYSAIYERTTSKYGERGRDRYVCMDLGHSAENVYLQAHALNIGTCAVGAFSDQQAREVMQLPDEETPLYIMPLGYIK